MAEAAGAAPGLNIDGPMVARNSLYNLAGYGLPLFVAFFSVPAAIKGLGVERFGILALLWVLQKWFAFPVLGFGRSLVKHLAEALGKKAHGEIPGILRTAAIWQAVLAAASSLSLYLLAPFLAVKLLSIPVSLQPEAQAAMRLFALTIPVHIFSRTLGNVLESFNNFYLLNTVRVAEETAFLLAPIAAVAAGFRLPGLVGLLLAVNFCALLFNLRAAAVRITALIPAGAERAMLRKVYSFGLYSTVCRIVANLSEEFGKFFVGAAAGVGQTTFLTIPQEITNTLATLASSLSSALFPALSAAGIGDKRGAAGRLHLKSLQLSLICVGALYALIAIFAREILGLWLGPAFSARASLPLQLLAPAYLAQCVITLYTTLLSTGGRQKAVLALSVAGLGVNVLLSLLLIPRYGITGAAAAMALRNILVMGLYVRESGKLSLPADREGTELAFAAGASAFAFTCLPLLLGSLPCALEAEAALAAGCALASAALFSRAFGFRRVPGLCRRIAAGWLS